jgi:hypothetical protein
VLSGCDSGGGYCYEILFHSLATPPYSVNAVAKLSQIEIRSCSLV